MQSFFCALNCVLLVHTTTSLVAQDVYIKRFELAVPARGLVGASPSRELNQVVELPQNLEPIFKGEASDLKVQVDLAKMDESHRKLSFRNGRLYIEWKVKNPHVAPIAGRTAKLSISIKVRRLDKSEELEKRYIALRKRYIEQFYFKGSIAAWYNPSSNTIDFGDQTIEMGMALTLFSLEAERLRKLGKSTDDSIAKINEILDAFDELDRKANSRYGGTSQLDGFFVRDDIEGVLDARLANRFAVVHSDWQGGAEKEMDTPSGDQIINLMAGLFAVKHYSGDPRLADRAKSTADRIFEYARRCNFSLKKPDGKTTRRGSEVFYYASLVNGVNKAITGVDNFDKCRIELPTGQQTSLKGVAAFWSDESTASSLANLSGREFDVPGIDQKLELNSFALHIILTLLSIDDVWDQAQLEKVAIKSNHHLSTLTYCKRRGVPSQSFSTDDIVDILLRCPDTGPKQSNPASDGWSHDNRWIRCTNIFENTSGSNEYNGVDWMMLYLLTN